MPMVPIQTTPTVAFDPGREQTFQAPNSENYAGKQLEALGQSTERLGGVLGKIAVDAQEQADRVRVIDAKNQLSEQKFNLMYDPQAGALQQKGHSALQREGGEDLATETVGKFKQSVSEISASLGNDNQRRMFAEHARNDESQLYGTVLHHLGSEFKSYTSATYDGAVTEAQRQIGMFGVTGVVPPGTEPGRTAIDDRIMDITAAIKEKARLIGLPQNLADTAVQAETSKAYTQAIEAALHNGNSAFAMSLLKSGMGSKNMVPADILRVQGSLNNAVYSQTAQAAVHTTSKAFMPQFNPSDLDRLTGIVGGIESNWADYGPDKMPLTSSAGAKYAMQVMPDTAKAPGYNIEPAKNDSPEEYNRVGKALLGALTTKYGEVPKVLAAYNAGGDWVDGAIKRAKEAEPGTKEADWFWQLNNDSRSEKNRKQTEAYVTKGMKKYNSGQGAPPVPSELEFVNSAVASLPEGSPPELIQRTQQQAEHQYTLISKAITQQTDQAFATAQRQLQENGGDLNALPPSTSKGIAPGKWDDLLNYSKKLKEVDRKTDPAAYNAAVTYPDQLAKMTDAEFSVFQQNNFSESDGKMVAKLRADQVNNPDQSAESLNGKATNARVDLNLQTRGVDPKPVHTDASANARIGAIRKFVNDSLMDAQKQIGRKFTQDEVNKFVDGAFMRESVKLGWFGSSSNVPQLTMTLDDIPKDTRKAIERGLNKRGIKAPDPAMVLEIYWKLENAKNATKG